MKHYIIYIPGLGDGYNPFRRFFLAFWRVFGVTVELVPMSWYDGKPYEEKYARINTAVTNALALGFRVSVVGESAGASIGMNVFANNEGIHRFISLCGINSANSPISSHIFKRSPAFKEAVSLLSRARAKAIKSRVDRVTVVTAQHDSTVPIEKNSIPGARRVTVWSMGHQVTVVLCLSFFSFFIVREVKRPLE